MGNRTPSKKRRIRSGVKVAIPRLVLPVVESRPETSPSTEMSWEEYIAFQRERTLQMKLSRPLYGDETIVNNIRMGGWRDHFPYVCKVNRWISIRETSDWSLWVMLTQSEFCVGGISPNTRHGCAIEDASVNFLATDDLRRKIAAEIIRRNFTAPLKGWAKSAVGMAESILAAETQKTASGFLKNSPSPGGVLRGSIPRMGSGAISRLVERNKK